VTRSPSAVLALPAVCSCWSCPVTAARSAHSASCTNHTVYLACSQRHPEIPLTGTYMQAGTQMYVVVLNCRQQRLATWISSIAELHKSRPAAAVAYSRPMPDVELLMQVCGTAAVQPAWQQSHVWISTWRGVDLRFRSVLTGGGWGGCSTAAHYSP
jgi:hypothetical protein